MKILRRYHHKLCEILDSSEPTFRSLTTNLFSEEIIDAKTKHYLLQKVVLGADELLDHVEKKVAAKPERMDVVLQIMDEEESLQDIVEEIRKGMIIEIYIYNIEYICYVHARAPSYPDFVSLRCGLSCICRHNHKRALK